MEGSAVSPPPGSRTVAAVLAGGRSSRFGSDKVLARFGGEPLLGRLLRLLRPLCGELLVVAKETAPYAALARAHGALLLTDASERKTPLSGLSAALDHLASPAPAVAPHHALALHHRARARLFAVAADMPFVADAGLLRALQAALDADAAAGAALAFHGGSLQTMAGLWVAPVCAPLARALLAREKVGPRALLDQLRVATVPWPDERGRPFLDADTPEALARLEEVPS